MAQELPCVVQECGYKTPNLELENASAMLKLHIKIVHPASQPQPPTPPTHGQRPQAARVKRPLLSFTGKTLRAGRVWPLPVPV